MDYSQKSHLGVYISTLIPESQWRLWVKFLWFLWQDPRFAVHRSFRNPSARLKKKKNLLKKTLHLICKWKQKMALCFVNKHLIQESCDQLCAMTHSGSRIWGAGQSKAVALFFPVLHFWHTNTATENFHLGEKKVMLSIGINLLPLGFTTEEEELMSPKRNRKNRDYTSPIFRDLKKKKNTLLTLLQWTPESRPHFSAESYLCSPF